MATKKAAPPDDVLAQYELSAEKWWWIEPPADLRADPVAVEFPFKKKTLRVKLYELPTKKRLVYFLGEDKKEGVGVWTCVYWEKDEPCPLKPPDGVIAGKPRNIKQPGIIGVYSAKPPA